MTALLIGGILIGLIIAAVAALTYWARKTNELVHGLIAARQLTSKAQHEHEQKLFGLDRDVEALALREGLRRYGKGETK